MAINVDLVYKTVLSILNKEQRGNITPDEFNKIANQVQLGIFERYFEDLNQQIRADQPDVDYANRVEDIDEKISVFRERGECSYLPSYKAFKLPVSINSESTNGAAVHRLGTVTYNDNNSGINADVERVTAKDFYQNQRSMLTSSSEHFPTYIYENQTTTGRKLITVSPSSITSGIIAEFIRKPKSVEWKYQAGTLGQLIYNSSTSVDFELHSSETVNVINRVLAYCGVVLEDPQIVQIASSKVQQDEINQKS